MKRKYRKSESRRGIALLLTLGILLLLTLLALGFSSSQLTESQAARNYYYAAKAEELALGGLEAAIAVLREDSEDNASDDLSERWALYYKKDDGFAGDDEEDADLSDYDELQYDVDESGDFRSISARKDPWKDPLPDSRWIEVRAVDPGSGEERAIGRYAVCIEDENAKVNVNTAGNPDPLSTSVRWTHRQNMGFTTAEIDLGVVLNTLGELFSDVFNDSDDYPDNFADQTALDIVAYRYGWNGGSRNRIRPGDEDRDDNQTSQLPPFLRQDANGIDDDADGMIDEPGEEIDEPGEFDPYEAMRLGSPGEFPVSLMAAAEPGGVLGDDTQYLTLAQIKMGKSVSQPSQYWFKEKDYGAPYPSDRLFQASVPYLTVYSQDLNRFSQEKRGGVEWMMRENIGRWLDTGDWKGPSEIEKLLRDSNLGIANRPSRTIAQIAVNIYDFIDPDWFPTGYAGAWGVEPTLYLNEVYPTPPEVPGAEVGVEGWVLDWGEIIELWNPYSVDLDVARYNVTVDSGTPQPIGPLAVGSTIVPARGFFLIGDTRGYIQNTGGTGPSGEKSDLPGRPPGCHAYAPLKLDAPLRMVLEVRRSAGVVFKVEEHDNVPAGGSFNVSAQKDDPRMPEWRSLPPSPGTINVDLSTQENVYSHFYFPGVRARAREMRMSSSFDTNDPNDLEHAGGLSNIGELGMVHGAEHWRSLNFTGDSSYGYEEDAKLLEVLTLPYQYKYSGPVAVGDPWPAREFVPGRININTAPPEVLLGLNWDGMFEELSTYGVGRGAGLLFPMIDYILKNRPYKDLSDVAEAIAEFPLLKDAPEGAKEAFLRYNANLITTKSNVFKITVLAESFDRRGGVVASRKLEAVVDRGYTPGSMGRTNEPQPTLADRTKAETARVLYFRWLTED